MATKRKINYWEILSEGTIDDSRLLINRAIETINRLNEELHPSRHRQLSALRGKMMMKHQGGTANWKYLKGIATLGEFPMVWDNVIDEAAEIEGETDNNKGILEETHIVISMNENEDHPIIAVESSAKGPKIGDIKWYLDRMLVTENIEAEFQFEPIFKFDLNTFFDRINDIASLKIKMNREDLETYSQYDREGADFFRRAFDFGDTEDISLYFGINFQKRENRYPTGGLRTRIQRFFEIFRENPQSLDAFKHFDVRAQDPRMGGKIRLFDLVQSKVASEVIAEKLRARSKYYNSNHLYNAIREQLEEDFRTEENN